MKVLLIGNGFIGDAHRNAYKTLIEQGVDVEVAAICDIREEMLQKNEFGAKILISEEPICRVSSTQIRDNIKNNKPFSHLLDPSVSDYIITNGLYGYEK